MIHEQIDKCRICGSSFWRAADEQWKTLCLDCWRASKCSRHDSATCARCFEAGKLAARSTTPALDKARIRELLQLAHPDKHNGSPLAARVTSWLLEQRSAAR